MRGNGTSAVFLLAVCGICLLSGSFPVAASASTIPAPQSGGLLAEDGSESADGGESESGGNTESGYSSGLGSFGGDGDTRIMSGDIYSPQPFECTDDGTLEYLVEVLSSLPVNVYIFEDSEYDPWENDGIEDSDPIASTMDIISMDDTEELETGVYYMVIENDNDVTVNVFFEYSFTPSSGNTALVLVIVIILAVAIPVILILLYVRSKGKKGDDDRQPGPVQGYGNYPPPPGSWPPPYGSPPDGDRPPPGSY